MIARLCHTHISQAGVAMTEGFSRYRVAPFKVYIFFPLKRLQLNAASNQPIGFILQRQECQRKCKRREKLERNKDVIEKSVALLLPSFSKLISCMWRTAKLWATQTNTAHTLLHSGKAPLRPFQYSTVPITVGL